MERKTLISVSISISDYNKLLDISRETDKTVSSLVRQAIVEWLGKRSETEK